MQLAWMYVKTKISGTKPSQTTTLDTIAYKFPKSCNISLKSEKVGIYFIFKYATIVWDKEYTMGEYWTFE